MGETLDAQFGAAIIAVILLAPEGAYWNAADLWGRRRAPVASPQPATLSREIPHMPRRRPAADAPVILKIEN